MVSAGSVLGRFRWVAVLLLTLTFPVAAAVVPTVNFTGPATYTPGSAASTYTAVLGNTGATTASSARLTTDFPAAATVTWSCVAAGAGTSCGAASGTGNPTALDPGTLAQNGTLTFTFSVIFASSLTTDPLAVVASFDGDGGGPDAAVTDSVSSSFNPTRVWSVAFVNPSPLEYVPGTSTNNLSLTVTNAGPSDGTATLSLPVPGQATVGNWACVPSAACSPASGTGAIAGLVVTRAKSGSVTINLTNVGYASNATSSKTWTATADWTDGNPSATVSQTTNDSVTLSRRAESDYSVTLTGNSNYTPGAAYTLTLAVANAGPTDGTAAPVALALPAGFSGTWSCQPPNAAACSTVSGSGNVATNVTLVKTGQVDIELVLAAQSSLLGTKTFSASIVPVVGDHDPAGNNSTSKNLTVTRKADLRVTYVAGSPFNPANVNPSGVLHYKLKVENLGPSDTGNGVGEPGVLINDTFPTLLEGDPARCPDISTPCWSYCKSDGGLTLAMTVAGCPSVATHNAETVARGNGSLTNSSPGIRLSAGSSSEIEVYARVKSTASGSFTNTASVAPAAVTPVIGDDVNANNSASHPTSVVLGTSVAVVKDDQKLNIGAGELDTYSITVTNTGTAAANNFRVRDALPTSTGSAPGFIPGSIYWTCLADAGACCNSNSANCGVGAPTASILADAFDTAVDLAPGTKTVFTVTGRVHPKARGVLTNSVLGAASTPSLATDTTSILAREVLSLTKELTSISDPDTNGNYELNYRIVASNVGPSFIGGATLADPLTNAKFDPSTVFWTCAALANPDGTTACAVASGSGTAPSVLVDLGPAGQVVMTLKVYTRDAPTEPLSNTATLTGPGGASVTAMETTSLSGSGNLWINVDNGQTKLIPGDEVDYVITVGNCNNPNSPTVGQCDDAFGARVKGPSAGDLFPAALENVTWTCAAATPIPGDLSAVGAFGPSNTSGNALVVSSDGRHAYVAGTPAGTVHAFQRDNVPGANFGRLTVLEVETQGVNDPQDGGSTVANMAAPTDIALSQDGALLYVLSQTAIVTFNRVSNSADPNFGKLSYASSSTTGMPIVPRRLLVTAQNMYVSGDDALTNGNPMVSIYRRDQVSGLPVHDVQFTASVPIAPGAMVASPADALLFVASTTSGELAAFNLNTLVGPIPLGRLLSRASTLTHADLAGASDLAISPAEQHLYVAAGGTTGKISMLGYAASSMSKNFVYSAPISPLASNLSLALSPDGEHLLVASGAGHLLRYRRDEPTGSLKFEEQVSDAALAAAADVAVSSDGRHVLVASASAVTNPVVVYARRAPDPRFAFIEQDRLGDAVTPSGTLPGLTAVSDVVVSPDGKHVYAVGLQDHALVAFRRDTTKGLVPATAGQHLEYLAQYVDGIAGFSGLNRPSAIQISQDGKHVFVTSEEGNSLAVLARNTNAQSPNFGGLSFQQVLRDGVGGVDGLLGARSITLDDSGRNVYVAGSFESAIAMFSRDAGTGALASLGVVRSGVDGVTGLSGIRDIVVTRDGKQLLGVSSIANSVVVFNRETDLASANVGRLSFLQARTLGAGDRLVAIAVPESTASNDNAHVYVVAENGHRLYVLRRNLDPSSTAFGTVQVQNQYANNSGGIARMNGPRDVRVSPNGARVYVGAQFGHSLLVFDRDKNPSSAGFGSLALVETRTDGIDGVDGLNSVYGIAVSADSRNVYAAGFGDNAVSSFVVGTGSSCSASGGGDLIDTVDVGRNGTLIYRVHARIRPDAATLVGVVPPILHVSAQIEAPPRFTDENPSDNTHGDSDALTPKANLSVSKNNGRVSSVSGESVEYQVIVRNDGLSNIAEHLTLTDLLGTGFVPGSAVWSCLASGSGALDFVDVQFNAPPAISGLEGISGLTLVADQDGNGPMPSFLAGVSVLDDSLVLFSRDSVDGLLTHEITVRQGDTIGSTPVIGLAGARSVAASPDGRFLYVVGRTSDALSVFKLSPGDNGIPGDDPDPPALSLVETIQGSVGLDQAVQVVLSPDASAANVYVVGANDDAIAVFSRNSIDGRVTWLQSVTNNAPVIGLDGVESLTISPDGRHAYALSGSGGSVASFVRSITDGTLTWRAVQYGTTFGTDLAGAASAVFSSDGASMYITAADANALVVLDRDASSVSGTFGELTYAMTLAQDVDDVQGLLAPTRAALTADNAHLYVTGRSGGTVSWFSRDPADGSLRFLGLRSNDSTGVTGLAGATDVVVDSVLNQVYVAGTQQDAITQFRRQSDTSCPPNGTGNLEAIPLRIAAGGSVTVTITVDVEQGYTGSLSNTASIDAMVPGVSPPDDPDQDTTPDNNSDTDVDSVALIADLGITKTDGLAEFDGLAGALAMAGDAQQLYVAGSSDNALGVFDVSPSPVGALSFNSFIRGGTAGVLGLAGVNDVLLSGDGDHVYATSPSENSVSTFRRNRSSGALTFVELEQNGVFGVTGLAGARAMAMSPDGAHLYVLGGFSNAIAVFARQTNVAASDYGRLTFKQSLQNAVGGVDGIADPVAVSVSPDGKHVYVLGDGTDTIAVFTRNPSSGSSGFGQLTYSTRYRDGTAGFSGLAGVRSLLINSAGTQVYVLATDSGNLVRLVRDTSTGALTPGEVLTNGLAGNEAGAASVNEAEGLPGTSGLQGASRIRWSSDQMQLYVAGAEANAIVRFAVAPTTGALSFVDRINEGDDLPGAGTGHVLGLNSVRDVLVLPGGEHLYSVSEVDGAANTFGRAPDGALSYLATLFDGLGGVAPGDTVTYQITATNSGPSAVVGAVVEDPFPDAFSNVTWTCAASPGAICSPGGTGSLNEQVDLAVGASVTFTAVAMVNDSASGRLINTATIVGAGNLDPDPSNNVATDADTVLSPLMDLQVELVELEAEAVPGNRMTYEATIRNDGPTYADDAVVSDLIPPALYNVAWTCSAVPVAGTLASIQDILSTSATPPNVVFSAVAVGSLGNDVYAAGTRAGQGILQAYRRNPLNGALVMVAEYLDGAAGVSGIGGIKDVVLSDDQRFVYAAGSLSDAIAVFSRDAGSGALTFIRRYQDGSAGIDGLGGVSNLLLSPGGTQLYAAGSVDDAIAIFTVNPSSGLLTPASVLRQTDPGVDGLNGVVDLAWSNNGSHLLAVANDNQSLAAFVRNAGTGALTPAALVQDFQLVPAAAGALLNPSAILVNGDQVFVASASNDRVSRFLLTTSPSAGFTYDFTILNGQAGVTGMVQPRALVFDPDQSRLYVGSAGGGLHLFSLLRAQPEILDTRDATTNSVLSGLAAIAFSHDLKQLYTFGSEVGGIGVWARVRGSRCPLSGVRQLSTHTVDIAPEGEVVYTLTGDIFRNAVGTLDYTVRADTRTAAEEHEPADNAATSSVPLVPHPDLSIDKTDGLLSVVAGTPLRYDIDVANAGISDAVLADVGDTLPIFPVQTAGLTSSSIAWTCDVNEPLAFTRTTTAVQDAPLAGVTAMALSPDRTRMYAVNPTTSALLVMNRSGDGSLSPAQVIQDGTVLGETTAAGLGGASNLVFTSDGRHLLVTAATANSLLVFSREPDGSLRFRQKLTSGSGGVVGLLGAADVVAAQDGRRVFVASSASHAIAVFSRDPLTGVLSFVERVADGLGTIIPDSNVIRGVRRLHLTADGRHLYAVAPLSSALSRFDVNATSGVLTYRGAQRSGSPGLSALAAARDLVGTPGDTFLYALGSGGVVGFERSPDGSLSVVAGGSHALAGSALPQSLVLDAFGARVSVADAAGAVHVFARDWRTGVLDVRSVFVAPGGVLGKPNELLHVGASEDLYMTSSQPSAIVQLDELPLSRCLLAAGTQSPIAEDVDIGVDGWAALQVDAQVHPSARGTLNNTASVTPGFGVDPNAANNTASDQTEITVVSDLSIQKVGAADAIAGEQFSYGIELDNAGPSDALGIRLVDALPTQLRSATWTCAATGTSACPASGVGDIDFTTDLHVGDRLTINVTGQIDPAYVGVMSNTSTVTPETGATDPTPGDHSDTVQTTVTARADVSVTKTDNVNTVVAGTALSYAITVANAGPSDAPQVRILDTLPVALIAANWTCSATGTTCPATGVGSPDFIASLPVGTGLTLVVNATVDPAAVGTLVNTVTAQVLGNPVDPQPSNNSATDTDIILVVPDLALQIVDGFDPYDQSGTAPLPYVITISNAGPSHAHNVVLEMAQSRVIGATIPANCIVVGSSLVMTCTYGTIAAGTSIIAEFNYAGIPITDTVFSVHGVVTTIDADPNLANNVADQSTQLLAGVSTRVSITDNLTVVPMGYRTTYRITVENVGSLTGTGIAVNVPIAVGLLNASWTCSSPNGGTCTAAGTGAISDSVTLARGQHVVYQLGAVVDPGLDPAGPLTITQTATISGGADIYAQDNAAVDVNAVTPVLFADGFEGPPTALVPQAQPLPDCDSIESQCASHATSDPAFVEEPQ